MKTVDIERAMAKRFDDHRRYAVAWEVGLTTGGARRRIDMVVADCYASSGFRIDGFEFKISKADLRNDLEDPDKHVSFFDKLDYFTLVCPEGMVDKSALPEKWGLLTVKGDDSTRYRRKPLALHDETDREIPRGFFASFVRAIQGRDPGSRQLEAARLQGFEEGMKAGEKARDSRDAWVDQRAGELEEYEELKARLLLYGDLDETLAAFERFQKAQVKWLPQRLRDLSQSLARSADELEGKGRIDAYRDEREEREGR